MKLRIILTSFTLFLLSLLNAQTLTIAQVYDFDPGDLIITRKYYDGDLDVPLYYNKDSIISKYFATNLDTIFYEIFRASYIPQYTQNGTATFSSDTVIDFYTNLNSITNHINMGNYCGLAPVDTFYTHSCFGSSTWTLTTSGLDTTCFEPNPFSSTFIQGIGGPFYSYIQGGDPNRGSEVYELIYVRKGNISCGTYYDFPTNITELSKYKSIIFPNPTVDILNISLNEAYKKVEIEIINITGDRILSQKNENTKEVSLNIKHLKNGIYFIQIKHDDQLILQKIIKQ